MTRRRECKACGKRFNTRERIEAFPPKYDGIERIEFDGDVFINSNYKLDT